MAYQALYRKFRPDTFDDVKGQDAIVRTLNNQIKNDHIGHAYLFCGTRGTGKTTIAKIFARAVNCENPSDKGPCGECEMCKRIASGNSMNVIEMDAASNNGVDDIRQVIEEVQYSPPEGKYKVYIIDEVHMLSKSAFNALLKTLEEPPAYLIFILATTEVHKVPITILSRCQRYDFKRIPVETIADRLRELLERENVEADDEAVAYIAKLADGALRDGLSLLEQCISFYYGQKLTYDNVLKILGSVEEEAYSKLARALAQGNVPTVLEVVNDAITEGKDLERFCSELLWYFRNVLVAISTDQPEVLIDMTSDSMAELKEIAGLLEPQVVYRYIRVLADLENKIKYASSKRVCMEIAMIRMCKPEMETDMDSIVNRVHNIERDIKNGVAISEEMLSNMGKNGATAKQNAVNREELVKKLEKALPDDVKQCVMAWDQIKSRLNPFLRTFANKAVVTTDDNYNLVLAFQDKTAMEAFEQSDSREDLDAVIADIINKKVNIKLTLHSGTEFSALPDLRDIFKGDVDIEFTD
ncbi:MAG: DNA polymerase III subunit gamma/tau [Eubacterium sp.]|nr:DNA polymerase III subunit gamma/tau [Eubacterium sp.]